MSEDMKSGSGVEPGGAASPEGAREARYAILALQREGNRRLAAALDFVALSPSQAEVLTVVGAYGPVTVRGLGEMLVCETGSPSRLVSSLVERGHLTRVHNRPDRREVSLELSASGRRLLPEIEAAEATVEAALFEGFGEARLRDFVSDVYAVLADRPVAEALRARFRREHVDSTT